MKKWSLFLTLVAVVEIEAKSSRCISVSEAWRGPWENGTVDDFAQGRAFFDRSIQKCVAFTHECEEWIEFRPDRGQVLCSHHTSTLDIYETAWEHARLFFRAFHHHIKPDSQSDPTLSQTSNGGLYHEQLAESVANESAEDGNTPDNWSFEHVHLHANSPNDAEPDLEYLIEHNEHVCQSLNVRPVHCRMRPTGEFLKMRDSNRDPLQTGRFLFDMFTWECTTTPEWITIVEERPICPPFYPTDTMGVCIPIEQCVVIIDVDNTRAFHHGNLWPFVMIVCSAAILVALLLHWYQNGPHRLRDRITDRVRNALEDLDDANRMCGAKPARDHRINQRKIVAALHLFRRTSEV